MLSQKQIRKRRRLVTPSSPIAASEANTFMRNIVPYLTTAPRPVINKVLKPMIAEFNNTFETNPNVTKTELREITKKAEENLNKLRNPPTDIRDIIVNYSNFYKPQVPSATIPNITPLELDYAPSINDRIINQFTERQPDFAIQEEQKQSGWYNKLLELAPAAATTAALLGIAYATSGDQNPLTVNQYLNRPSDIYNFANRAEQWDHAAEKRFNEINKPLFPGRHFPTTSPEYKPRVQQMQQQIGDDLYEFKVV